MVHGFVAVTDPSRWERLAHEPGPKDANFWRRSTRAFRCSSGRAMASTGRSAVSEIDGASGVLDVTQRESDVIAQVR